MLFVTSQPLWDQDALPSLLYNLLLYRVWSNSHCLLSDGPSVVAISSVQSSCSVVSNSLQPHELQHARWWTGVHHQLPEFTHTHVCWVGDAIQPSHMVVAITCPQNPSWLLTYPHCYWVACMVHPTWLYLLVTVSSKRWHAGGGEVHRTLLAFLLNFSVTLKLI